jgi:hypothetical protein
MRMVSDELVDNNLRDMHGTNNTVQSIKLFLHVFNRLRTSVVLTLKRLFKSP